MSFDEKEFHAVVLGALLHDIGKFVQRAQDNPTAQDHPHWGEDWFENHLSEKLASVFDEAQKQIIRSAIGNHHAHEKYISLADAISSGMDRISISEEEGAQDPFTARVISIFSKISISKKVKLEKFYRLAPLGEENFQEIFPTDDKKCTSKEYALLLKKFEKEIEAANFSGLGTREVVDFLYFILWKYCWCVPSATYKTEPDIPLFDHLKTTAAIAGCLYAYQREEPMEELSIDTKALCLIAGDISGIQNYIFDVLTQQGKVAKRLRARSFLIQLVSEVASHKILHAFRLPLCNLILSAGGNFHILAPNLKSSADIVNRLQEQFDNWTLQKLNAELFLSLALQDASGSELADFRRPMDMLKERLSRRKYLPHREVLTREGKWLINQFVRPEVVEGDEKACRGCHKSSIREPLEPEEPLCERCSADTKIGQLLPKAKYVAFFRDNFHSFEVLDYSVELWKDENLSQASKESPYLLLALNDSELKLPVIGFKYLASHIPTTSDVPSDEVENGHPVTFNDIAKRSNGDKLLGYVKADVDNLGLILREGFKDAKLSISRFSTFSRLLETFFSGYLHVVMEEEYKENYVVFSGGDDFFVLGPWNRSIDFANTIRRRFSDYCAGNPEITFSAGIILAKPHEPISYCADVVETQLKQSKRKEGKDSITLFGQTVTWDELEQIILKEAKRVIEWLKKEPPAVSRSFVSNLRRYGEMALISNIFNPSLGVNTKFLRFVPLLVCDIKRNLGRKDQEKPLAWVQDLVPTPEKPLGGKNLGFLATIMHYVLTCTRS